MREVEFLFAWQNNRIRSEKDGGIDFSASVRSSYVFYPQDHELSTV